MNTYPALNQRLDSNRALITDIDTSVSDSNRLATISYQGGVTRKRYTLRHVVTSAERSTLRTFYDNNQFDPFYFRLTDSNDNGQEVAVFMSPPDERKLSNNYWLIQVELETWQAYEVPGSFLLLESGDYLLQENGDKIGL